MSGRVECVREGSLATVVLVHEGKFNAMSRAMWRELRSVFVSLAAEEGLRSVVIRGQGGHFCAGGDIAEYPGFRHDEEELTRFHEDEVWGALDAILRCDVPVVAAIQGNCMGAGVEIASCCDLRVAGESCRFGAPIAKLGFPMAPREAQLVAGAVGLATAREMLLAAAVLDARTLWQRGFLNRLVPDAEVFDTARAWTTQMASLSPLAARLNKRTLRDLGQGVPVDALVAQAYAYADHAEHQEGIAAFLAKRPPQF